MTCTCTISSNCIYLLDSCVFKCKQALVFSPLQCPTLKDTGHFRALAQWFEYSSVQCNAESTGRHWYPNCNLQCQSVSPSPLPIVYPRLTVRQETRHLGWSAVTECNLDTTHCLLPGSFSPVTTTNFAVDGCHYHLISKSQNYLQERAIKNFWSADPAYGDKIRHLIQTQYSKKPSSTKASLWR